MVIADVRTHPARSGRWRDLALGTALFLLTVALILAMHVLDPRRQDAGASEHQDSATAPGWSAPERADLARGALLAPTIG